MTASLGDDPSSAWSCSASAVVLYAIAYPVLKALGSWGPQWDAWILTGSILATYGMARGFVEFWLIWIAVDVVGVPLLVQAKFYPSRGDVPRVRAVLRPRIRVLVADPESSVGGTRPRPNR